jgi:hypothetical protein
LTILTSCSGLSLQPTHIVREQRTRPACQAYLSNRQTWFWPSRSRDSSEDQARLAQATDGFVLYLAQASIYGCANLFMYHLPSVFWLSILRTTSIDSSSSTSPAKGLKHVPVVRGYHTICISRPLPTTCASRPFATTTNSQGLLPPKLFSLQAHLSAEFQHCPPISSYILSMTMATKKPEVMVAYHRAQRMLSHHRTKGPSRVFGI